MEPPEPKPVAPLSKPQIALLAVGLALLAAAGLKLGSLLSQAQPEPIASAAVVLKPSAAEVAVLPAASVPLVIAAANAAPSAAAPPKPKYVPLAVPAAPAQDPTSDFGGRR